MLESLYLKNFYVPIYLRLCSHNNFVNCTYDLTSVNWNTMALSLNCFLKLHIFESMKEFTFLSKSIGFI